jgi:hypothetical protein
MEQTLELAKSQLKDQASQLEQTVTQLALARATLVRQVEERAADRSRFDAQAEAATQERERLQVREQATERRLLEEVDRARQEAKRARSELAETARRHEALLNAAERAKQRAMESDAAARLEIAALRERLSAAEQWAHDLLAQFSAGRPVRTFVCGSIPHSCWRLPIGLEYLNVYPGAKE